MEIVGSTLDPALAWSLNPPPRRRQSKRLRSQMPQNGRLQSRNIPSQNYGAPALTRTSSTSEPEFNVGNRSKKKCNEANECKTLGQRTLHSPGRVTEPGRDCLGLEYLRPLDFAVRCSAILAGLCLEADSTRTSSEPIYISLFFIRGGGGGTRITK